MGFNNAQSSRRYLSQINVTPFVDVMLVLLIIFMVTAPMMQAGIEVELPRVEAAAIESPDEPIVITIDKDKTVRIGKRTIKAGELRGKLAAINKETPGRTVLLRADGRVPYGTVAEAISDVRQAGIEKVGMVTEPLERRR